MPSSSPSSSSVLLSTHPMSEFSCWKRRSDPDPPHFRKKGRKKLMFTVLSLILLSTLIPTAAAKLCPHPAVPLYSQVNLSDDTIIRPGSIATYRCDDGYELFGTPVRTCNSQGRWSGDLPYCAVNVAYGKPTNQSSTIRGGESRNANDGDLTTFHENKFCTETKNEGSPWWMVDLLQPYEVRVIRILTRGCCGQQPLHDIEIRVGNSSSVSGNRLCAWYPGTLDDATSKDLPCAHPIKGRFVFIQMVGVEASLSLCEVFVFTTKEFSPDRCGSRFDQQQLISFNQTCYEFQTQNGGSYIEATDYCKSRGGLVVNSVDNITHNFLFYELERLKGKMKSKLIWLGAHRELTQNHPSFHRSRSNTWKWANGGTVSTFLWAEDQPNNYNGQQNCIVLDGGRKWLWNDVTCDLDYLPWICQYTPSNCGSPDKFENSTIVDKDFRVGKEIAYRCPLGHMVEGAERRKCLPDGFWSESPPTCKYVNCGPLPDINRGRVMFPNASFTSFNSSAVYVCDKDYTIVGNETRTCLGNSSWSGSEPKCLYSWCPELSLVQNGHLSITNRTLNGIASYICKPGHKLQGNGTRECLLGGKWSGDEPICRFVDCGIPLSTKNGRYDLLNGTTTYLSIVKYTCHDNFSLMGNGTRNCTETGSWAGDEPSCRQIPVGADITGERFTVDSEVTYKCKPGYKMTNSERSVRKCNRDAKWDAPLPECKYIDCGRVPVILKGEVKYVNGSTHLDSIANYTCAYGFQVSGSRTRVCKEDGKWSDASPKCEEIRCVPPQIPKNSSVVYSGNDRSTSESFKVGSTVQYKCATGHVVKGESLRTCEQDGNWNGQPPECQYVDCGWPFLIANGRWLLTSNTTHYGSALEYECNDQYRIIGPARRLCLEDGSWSGASAPVCDVIHCNPPPTKDDKTVVEGTNYNVGEKVQYTCLYGYELVGEEVRTCSPEGEWTHEVPYCRIVDCGRPSVLPNGRGYLLNSSTTYDSVIEYHCMSEYKIIGDPIRRCLPSGSWSGSLPRCVEHALLNEIPESDLDARSDSRSNSIHSQLESSKAIGIGIAIGIGGLLVLIMTVAVVCLKTKKPQPIKNNDSMNEINPNRSNLNMNLDKDTTTVMSYSRLSLESEAAAAAANSMVGGIRHNPNGLVTFMGNGKNNKGNGSSTLNGTLSNGHSIPPGPDLNHLHLQQMPQPMYSNAAATVNTMMNNNNGYHRQVLNANGVTGSTISVAIRSPNSNGSNGPSGGTSNNTSRFVNGGSNGHTRNQLTTTTTTLDV